MCGKGEVSFGELSILKTMGITDGTILVNDAISYEWIVVLYIRMFFVF